MQQFIIMLCRRLTHKLLFLLAKQFLAVFRRCGGSEKKKISSGGVKTLGVLYVIPFSLGRVCILNIFLLHFAPSHVTAITLKSITDSLSMVRQSNENNSYALRVFTGKSV